MKVICDRGALVDALAVVGGVVVSRTPSAVLLCVKLSADNGVLRLAATDLEVSVTLDVAHVDVQEDGEIVVPADKLSGIVRESGDPTLTIESEGESAQIRGADSFFKIFGRSPAEFPDVEDYHGDSDLEIDGSLLVDLIHRTQFATARENSRYAINGVLFERNEDRLTMVATDGKRLAMAKGRVSAHGEQPLSVIVPAKPLNLLCRLFDEPDQVVKFKVLDGKIAFSTDTASLIATLVEGNFPPYQDVLPKDKEHKAVFATDALSSGVRRAALLTNDESKCVRMSFSSDGLVLTSRAPEMGEAEVKVPVESYDGEPIDIGFNPYFITDVLKVAHAPSVTIELKAPSKPGIVKVGTDFLYVVMPLGLS